jgi:hypothetical protein
MPEQIRRILGKHGRSPDELIPILQDVQAAFGYIGEPQVKAISRYPSHLGKSDLWCLIILRAIPVHRTRTPTG